MKLTQMVYTLVFTTLLANSAFASTAPQKWSLTGGPDYQLTVSNDSDQAQYLEVTTASERVIGGDVFVTPNSVTLRCIGPSMLARVLKPGQSARCIVRAHGFGIITLLPRPTTNWGAEGTYNFVAFLPH